MSAARSLFAIGILSFLTGCSQQSVNAPASSTEQITATSFNVSGAPTVEFNAPDMMCPEGCGAKVKEILSGQPGAKEVVVDFDAKTAKVAVEDASKFDSNAAVAALVDHGFKNSSVKDAAGDKASAKPNTADQSAKSSDGSSG